jgi:hypothetical protein
MMCPGIESPSITDRSIAEMGARIPVAEKGLVPELLGYHAIAVDRLVAEALC